MIEKLIICGVLALGGSFTAFAGDNINSPDAAGCLARGLMMYGQGNYAGCIDQIMRLDGLHPAPAESEDGLWLMAMASLKAGDDEALALLDRYIATYPASYRTDDVKAATGDYYFMRRSFGEALERYDLTDPENLNNARREEVTYRMAYSSMMTGNARRAAAGFRTLVNTREYRNAANFYLGYLSYEEGRYNEALEYFNKTDRNRPPANDADYYLSQIYFMKGDYRQALELAKSTLNRSEATEFRAEANRVAGESLYRLGRESEALPYLRKYMSLVDDPAPSALYILGLDAFRNEDYSTAVGYLRGATATDDAMGQSAWLYLGQAYVKTDNLPSALMAFEKAYRQSFDREVSETAFYNYAVAKVEGARIPFGNSVTMFEDFLSQYPDSRYAAGVQDYIVNGYLADNDYEAALQSINRMSRPSAASIEAKQRALFMLGTRLLSSGNAAAARERFLDARAIKASPEIALQCDLWLGDCYYSMGQYSNAVKSYRAYLSGTSNRDSNRALALYDLGYAYYAAEDYGQALTSFRQALAVTRNPLSQRSQADATNRIADCLYYSHKFAEAATEYRKAYDLDASAGDYALYQLAVMKGLDRDYRAKIATLDRLIDLFPTSALAPAALLAKGESYSALDDNNNAIATYRDVVSSYPSSGYARKAQLQMAITYLAASQRQQAIEAYRQVIFSYPSSEEAKVATDDLKRIYADDGRLAEFASFLASVPNAPKIDPSEMDALAFRAAEREYLDHDNTSRLKTYLSDYPSGTYRPQALYYMAEALATAGDADGAYGYVTELTEKYPDSDVIEDAMLIKAETESSQGKKEIALDTYRRLESIAASPLNLSEARLGIMRTAAELGRHSEVVEAAGKLLSSSAAANNESEICFTRAAALDALGSHSEAEAEWRQLAATPSQLYGAQSAVMLAQSLLDRGNTADARKVIDTFLDANTPHQYWQARGFIVLSDILRKQGDTFEANEYLKSLRNNYPGKEQDIFNMIDSRLK